MTMQAVSVDPIVRTITVDRSVEDAFRLFTDGIDTWWPTSTHSYGGDDVERTIFETREGGRLYEVQKDGTERDWAEVVAWEPPDRIVLAWKICSPTEVEVRFSAQGSATRVELEHRGWENVDDERRAQRDGYAGGWEFVLGKLAEAD